MKKSKIIALTCVIFASIILFSACSGRDPNFGDGPGFYPQPGNTYTELNEHDFLTVTEETKKSYISLSTNTASYGDLRRQILNNKTISKDAVKIEEMLNYFNYDYAVPEDEKPLSMNALVMDTPWNTQTKLLIAGMQSEKINMRESTNNIVFLVDVSGSMFGNDRLGLAVHGLTLLVDQLTENDMISLVTYAGHTSVIMDGVKGDRKELIKEKLLSLEARGSTAGGSAIDLAYETASKHKNKCDNSTIILITDGDFNVGISSPAALKDKILLQKAQGIGLSVAGVGYGNMRSDVLETIADAGGGRHAYISNIFDAKKFLVEELGAILNAVAKDAKAEIAFNPNVVSKYRIIGYENRQLTQDEWENDQTNAGTIGSGTTVTVVYEIVLTENSGDFAELSLKYKVPQTLENRDYSFTITDSYRNSSADNTPNKITDEDGKFISAVVEIGLLLRDSHFAGTASYLSAYNRLFNLDSVANDNYKKDFLMLVETLLNR